MLNNEKWSYSAIETSREWREGWEGGEKKRTIKN